MSIDIMFLLLPMIFMLTFLILILIKTTHMKRQIAIKIQELQMEADSHNAIINIRMGNERIIVNPNNIHQPIKTINENTSKKLSKQKNINETVKDNVTDAKIINEENNITKKSIKRFKKCNGGVNVCHNKRHR